MSRQAFYDFGRTTFSNYIWISGGFAFFNPRHFDIEIITNQPMTLQIYDSQDKYQGKRSFPKGYHWQSANLSGLPRGKRYKLKLINSGSGTVQLLQGQLAYEQLLTAA